DELGLATRDVDVAAVGDPGDDELRHPPEQLLVVERLRQLLRRLEEEREPGARALGLAPGGDFLRYVARDVDDELDAAVRREHGRGAQREPALPAARARADADDGRALRAGERLRGRLVFGRDSSAVGPVVRRVAVEHELPEQPATAHERDEGERPDSLLAHHALERRLELRAGEIVDEHGLWVLNVRRPRRVPLGEGAVAIGEPAPG